MNLFYDRTPIDKVDDALFYYKASDCASPTRSISSLSWLKHDKIMVGSVLNNLGMPADSNLHLEYKVKPQQGNASHTDLMVISGTFSLAVEAKWTESRYETVGKWLSRSSKVHNANNKRDVITGWLDLLQNHTGHSYHIKSFSNVVYQMVHRAASACEAGSNPSMAYLVSTPLPKGTPANIQQIHADLTCLRSLLGKPTVLPFYLVEAHLSPTGAFNAIVSLTKADKATEQKVRAALSGNNRFFNFEKFCVTRI